MTKKNTHSDPKQGNNCYETCRTDTQVSFVLLGVVLGQGRVPKALVKRDGALQLFHLTTSNAGAKEEGVT